jgi:hypothetical protein
MICGKFVLMEVTTYGNNNPPKLVFYAMHNGELSDDNVFAKGTPEGKLEIVVSNNPALEQLKKGCGYILTLTKIG